MKRISFLTFGLLLPACAGTLVAPENDPYPANWKQEVVAHAQRHFFDWDSAKQIEVSEPAKISYHGWVVCMNANAKNRMGAYTGIQTQAYAFAGGKVNYVMNGALWCGSAKYAAL